MNYFIETSWKSLNHYGEELCGDKVETIVGDDGVLLVLSDGLGSGVKANILASLTSKIIASMVSAGAKLTDVVETIVSTLPVDRERNVAYSTFSLVQISRDGSAYMVEFDNPTMVILRDGKRVFIPWENQQLSGKEIHVAHMQLRLDDKVVLFSDGVIHAGVGRALNMGWQHENVVQFLEETSRPEDKSSDIQHRLLEQCYRYYEGQCGDDTTVAVMRVCQPRPCCVMVGPPVHKEDDIDVVEDLLSTQGMKVVCGGTTSQIVGKYLGEDMTIDMEYISPEVPPIGHMKGIDLVTEGVVTLGRALEILENYSETMDPAVLTEKKDGAHLLCEAFIQQCTSVRFIVGRALNPAHQNPDMPISLSIKLRLVKDIADCLRKLGKPVTLRYC